MPGPRGMTESLPLDGRSLTLEQFLAVARGGCAVSLTPESRTAVGSSRRAVERALGSGRPIYGINTGFGGLSHHVVPAEQGRQLQLSLLRSHASGTGAALPADVVRGMMLARLNSLARGLSGVRVELLERLAEFLNHGLVPIIPEQGSVGASGDLAPLAHLGLALTGEGAFLGRSGAVEPGREVLHREGVAPYEFAEKEGVALINGTSLMCAYLELSVADARTLLAAAEITAARTRGLGRS